MSQQPTVPVCYRHPARETYLRCSRCDRPICPDCMHQASVGQHCPECAAGAGRGQRAPRTAFGGALDGEGSPVTKVLIGLNVAVAVGVFVLGGAQAVAGGGMAGLLGGLTPAHVWGGLQTGPVALVEVTPGGGLVPGLGGVAQGEYYRLLTSMFLHYGVFHLALNMFALWIVGSVLEPLLGRARFLALYLLSGIGGGVATYLFESAGVSAGASGAVFGLFAAFYVTMRRLGRDTSAITMILVVNLILTFVIEAISVWGHLGGLVTGGVIAVGLAYAPREHRAAVQWSVVGGVAVLLAALTVARTLALSL